MVKREFTNKRDLSFSRWHRTLPDWCWTSDIDFMEYQYENGCIKPICLIETCAISKIRWKKTDAIVALAKQAGLPAYVIAYNFNADTPERIITKDGLTVGPFQLWQIWPKCEQVMNYTEDELREWFKMIHSKRSAV